MGKASCKPEVEFHTPGQIMLGHKYFVNEKNNLPNGRNIKQCSGVTTSTCHMDKNQNTETKNMDSGPWKFSLQPLYGNKEMWIP